MSRPRPNFEFRANVANRNILVSFYMHLISGGTSSGSCASGFGVCCVCKFNKLPSKSPWVSNV